MTREFLITAMQIVGYGACLAGGGFILYSVYRRFKEGAFNLYGTPIVRVTNPASFWFFVFLALIGAMVLVYKGVGFLLA